jgi:quercetin dioxygenase-like cupin family protein
MTRSTILTPFASDRCMKRSLWYLGDTLLTILATAEETGGALGLVLASGRKGAGPPPHTHRNEDETFYLLKGEGTFYVGGEAIKAVPGTCVFLPRGIEHWFTIDSDEATVLNLITPGGFESFFKELSVPAQSLTLPPPPSDPPDMARLTATQKKYGIIARPMEEGRR